MLMLAALLFNQSLATDCVQEVPPLDEDEGFFLSSSLDHTDLFVHDFLFDGFWENYLYSNDP